MNSRDLLNLATLRTRRELLGWCELRYLIDDLVPQRGGPVWRFCQEQESRLIDTLAALQAELTILEHTKHEL